jgi:hypothetical protein
LDLFVSHEENEVLRIHTQHRFNALKGIWCARQQWAKLEKEKKKVAKQKSSARPVSKTREIESSDTELSLSLIVCLIESQARLDPALMAATTRILTNHFRNQNQGDIEIFAILKVDLLHQVVCNAQCKPNNPK